MVKVRNIGKGIYADGVIFVQPGEAVEVMQEKADYLLSIDTPGHFELVEDAPVVPADSASGKASNPNPWLPGGPLASAQKEKK